MSLGKISEDMDVFDGFDWQRIALLEGEKTVIFAGIHHRVSVLDQQIGGKSLITFMATPLPPSLDVHPIGFHLFDGELMSGGSQSPLGADGALDVSYVKAFLRGFQLLD